MEFRIQNGVTATEVFLSGKLTMRDHDAFLQMADSAAGSGAGRVVIDLSGIDFIDSAGLGLLLVAHEKARAQHRQGVILRRPQPHILRLLDLGDFRRVMTVEA
ncbi:stage II sporulation protein AA (anti-sigma F factor antagonist) [Azospirillum fermentarium]|uniref:STAS domain-containing protein n=1 Tax=Azospirillum fermentarium TaxID=1233114 RepID=UPI002227791A|nr:STAS domain-containing protein [Azospirillum fermentarium]MCW2244597.1 stage II sporulation protein AA (anti-sigma F factor antagonist) [Azospirillum fermentarium]